MNIIHSQQSKNIHFSVVVPVYNEEKSINDFLNKLKKTLKRYNYEIIVVNDGSNDKTKELLEKIQGINKTHHSENRGYGAALKTGIKQTRSDLILIIDADGTYPNESIHELIKHIPDYDMVVGARMGKKVKVPLIRKPAKWIINKLANYLSGVRIPDLNSGLRIIKRSLIEKFIPLLPNGFSFTATITLAALTNNYSIKYVPIDYSKRIGKSKIRPIKDTLNFLQLIIRTVLYFNPLKIFFPLSLLLFLLGAGVFIYSYFFTAKTLDTTTAIFVISSIQILAVGMLADLIVKRNK